MTTIDTYGTTNLQVSNLRVSNLVMFLAAIGIAAMIIVTHPFDLGSPLDGRGPGPHDVSTAVNSRPQLTDWCCLGSKPAEWIGRGMTDVGETTGSVDKIPRRSPLIVEMVALDSVTSGKPPRIK